MTTNLTNYTAYQNGKGEDEERNGQLMRTLTLPAHKGNHRSDGSDSGNSDESSDTVPCRCGGNPDGRMDPGVKDEVLEFVSDPEVMGLTQIYKNSHI